MHYFQLLCKIHNNALSDEKNWRRKNPPVHTLKPSSNFRDKRIWSISMSNPLFNFNQFLVPCQLSPAVSIVILWLKGTISHIWTWVVRKGWGAEPRAQPQIELIQQSALVVFVIKRNRELRVRISVHKSNIRHWREKWQICLPSILSQLASGPSHTVDSDSVKGSWALD